MSLIDGIFDRITQKLGVTIQGYDHHQAYRDYEHKGEGYSVEAEVSEALADLVTMFSAMPISGDSERARFLDGIADDLFRTKIKPIVASAFMTGDCLVVPSWNGRSIQNVAVNADDFEITSCLGDEITSCLYVVDRTTRDTETFRLVQGIDLVPYKTTGGEKAMANRYRMFVVRGNGSEVPLSSFPQWADIYDTEWFVPGVDRLLIGRMKSHVVDPVDLNAVKGAPICFGASEPIREIHYLLDQMHAEFGLSEKMIMADKRLFKKEPVNGVMTPVLPRGKEKLFMATGSFSSEPGVSEWSPEIRYQAYLEALDKQEKLVERAVGVSSGIISTPNDMNYQNVDNVRKSQQKTMGFVSTARRMAESCLSDLVYAWDVLANYHGITPMGSYDVSFDWSNEYVETFADRQNAIIAGINVGAMDAVDYRMFVTDESPEVARQRVEEIKAEKAASQTFAIEEV